MLMLVLVLVLMLTLMLMLMLFALFVLTLTRGGVWTASSRAVTETASMVCCRSTLASQLYRASTSGIERWSRCLRACRSSDTVPASRQ